MKLSIPTEPLYILFSLKRAGYEAYLVGGAVRDLIRWQDNDQNSKVTDYDFTTNAKPEEILEVFTEGYYENEFGMVGVTLEDVQDQLGLPAGQSYFYQAVQAHQQAQLNLSDNTKIHESLQESFDQIDEPRRRVPPFEITTFRSDGLYQDHRRPESVEWGENLESDLERRDFTINAMAIDVSMEVLEKLFIADQEYLPKSITIPENKFKLIDPHHGRQDLESEVLHTVGDPKQRFEEDALRMLRAIRFSVQLNIKIANETYTAISQLSHLMEHISAERIRDEFFKMLVSDFPKQAVEMMDETGLLQYVLPELLAAKGVEQGGHHTTDVWTHSLDALAECPSRDPVVKLATLLHDIAKPETYEEQNGSVTFYNHEVVGARTAKQVAQRLKLSKKETERVFILVRYHMFHYQPNQTDAALRRFMRKVGLQNLNDILDLREGDRLGSGAKKTSWRLEEMKQRMIEQLNQPFSVTDLEINGHDLQQELNMKPGPEIGELLNQLFEEVVDNPDLNTRERLLSRAKSIQAESSN